MAEITIGRTLSAATDSVTVEQGSLPWVAAQPLVPVDYDEIVLGYTGANVTSVTYKKASSTVATLQLTYTGSNLTGVKRV
jgi:hypothetical protein